jgi:hypothetical protein
MNPSSLKSLTSLQKLKVNFLEGAHVSNFISALEKLTNLKKLDIIRMEKEFAHDEVTQFHSFLLNQLQQFEYVNLPRLRFIDACQIQKNYPNTRFRWYYFRSSGLSTLPSRDYYEGDFSVENKFEGRGLKSYFGGSMYEGEFKGGMKEGFGKLFIPGMSTYEGEWKKNKCEGNGIIIYSDLRRYEGEFKNGVREGRGIYTTPGGDVYDGEFKNDSFNGRGIYSFASGYRYEGDFKNGVREGKGTLFYPDARRYEGEFKNYLKDGKGIFYNLDGYL